MLAIAESRCAPRASAEGSLNDSRSVDPAPAFAPAGVGVAGGFDAVFEAGAGAAGAAGVCAVAGAGVEGALAVDVEAAGGALGYCCQQLYIIKLHLRLTHLRNHANDETFLFDAVRLNGICIGEYLS